jgi:hypothetical protein
VEAELRVLGGEVVDEEADGEEEHSHQGEDSDAGSLELRGDEESDATASEASGEAEEEDPTGAAEVGLAADGVEEEVGHSHKETQDGSIGGGDLEVGEGGEAG